MDAAKGGHIEVAQLLLQDCKDSNVSIEPVDSQGRQPLHHASQTGATDTVHVKLLVAEGAKINAKTSETGRTALHYAAKSNSKCEGCQTVCPSVQNYSQFQCARERPYRLCDKCRNRATCPIHIWAKKR